MFIDSLFLSSKTHNKVYEHDGIMSRLGKILVLWILELTKLLFLSQEWLSISGPEKGRLVSK